MQGNDANAVIFFDVDGTIVWHDPANNAAENVARARPSAAVADAFARLRARGHAAIICTGRPLCLVQQPLLDLEPAGLVLSAGACLYMDGRVIEEHMIDEQLLVETLLRFTDLGIEAVFEGTNTFAAYLPNGGDYTDIPGTVVTHSLEEMRDLTDMRFSKFSFTNDMLPKLAQISDFIDAHYGRYDLGLGTGECTLLGVDKGAGVRSALSYLQHGVHNTYAFGDSENDLPMLRAVETPVAMGNALDSVKAMAAYVTDTAEHDGVATGLEHFGLV